MPLPDASALIDPRETDLVIFDCDGVLVDSEPLSNAVMAEHITRLGWPMDGAGSIRRFKGKTMSQVHAAVEDHLGHAADPSWLDAFRAELMTRMETELRAVPGIEALIARLHGAGIATCVASQGSHAKMRVSLGATGLFGRFEGRIFSAGEVARPKPFPDLFLHAAAILSAPPGRCCVIEDSPTGITAALAAHMRDIGLDADGDGTLQGAEVVRSLDAIGVR